MCRYPVFLYPVYPAVAVARLQGIEKVLGEGEGAFDEHLYGAVGEVPRVAREISHARLGGGEGPEAHALHAARHDNAKGRYIVYTWTFHPLMSATVPYCVPLSLA